MRNLRRGQLPGRAHLDVCGIRIVGVIPGAMYFHAVSGIGHKMRHLQLNGRGRTIGNRLCIKRSIAHLLIRLLEIPEDSGNVSILGGQHCLRIGRPETLALKRVKVFVGEVRRLANALRVQQPETSLKRSGRRAGFFEKIGIGPVAHALEQSLTCFELGENVGRADVGIVHRVARRITCAPLGKVQRKPSERGS